MREETAAVQAGARCMSEARANTARLKRWRSRLQLRTAAVSFLIMPSRYASSRYFCYWCFCGANSGRVDRVHAPT